MSKFKLTIGADPEFFLVDAKGNPISAHDIVPGTKQKPHKLPKGGAVQADGTAVEFNIEPASTSKEFSRNLDIALGQVREFVPVKYKFHYSPSVFYPEDYFKKIPDTAKELGCDPDMNAANGMINPPPTPTGKFKTMRTAAGHIHLGWTSDKDRNDPSHMFDCRYLARALDMVFRPCMQLWDTDKDRRQLYGGTAAYRIKPYGVEYRALSVAWLKHPKLYPWIFDTAKNVFDKLASGSYSIYTFDDFMYSTGSNASLGKVNTKLRAYNYPTIPEDYAREVRAD